MRNVHIPTVFSHANVSRHHGILGVLTYLKDPPIVYQRAPHREARKNVLVEVRKNTLRMRCCRGESDWRTSFFRVPSFPLPIEKDHGHKKTDCPHQQANEH